MARYDGIWKIVKDTGHCAITAPIKLQRRIIRGVIKAKDEDLVYKLQQTDKYKRSKLTFICECNRVRFFLTQYIRLDMVNEVSIGSSNLIPLTETPTPTETEVIETEIQHEQNFIPQRTYNT